ncbi:MAG: hypothetical protein JOZ93_17045 [Sinobacteraceae bacterium]|nr:hypothetical protein [Nevskiaceae bacterium]MBV9914288.1 hypothetical protein [Nevskiaceae bacterium]
MIRKLAGRSAMLTSALALMLGASAASAGPGAHGGGAAAGGFHGGGGFRGGGFHGAGGWRGSGWHGYGWHGYGWRRGWGCCGWGWGWGWGWPWGWGLGWYLPVLPLGFQTYWWNDVPYYYANNAYYVWNGDVGQYEAVAPPASGDRDARDSYSLAAPGSVPRAAPRSGAELFAYPKAHQSEEQQARDREECRQWAAKQTGSSAGASQAQTERPGNSEQRAGYLRAQAACLEGRNYSVR